MKKPQSTEFDEELSEVSCTCVVYMRVCDHAQIVIEVYSATKLHKKPTEICDIDILANTLHSTELTKNEDKS